MSDLTTPTGDDVLFLARQHLKETYILGTLAPKDNRNWRGPWDCAEFASWLTYQIAGVLYGCEDDQGNPATANAYTGYWSRDADIKGRKISIEQAASTPGAAILRVPQAGATGHIVISDGRGRTIEANSSKKGVINYTLANRRWDFGILVPGIEYVEGLPHVELSSPQYVIYRLTHPCMTDSTVEEIQQALKREGLDPGNLDSEYGPHTQAAVVAFQLSKHLVPDGEVGPITARALGVTLPLENQPVLEPF